MKRHTYALALCAGAIVAIAGCNKAEPPVAPTAAPQVQSTPGPQETPSTPTAPMPPPDVPKGDETSGPKPGQANDHSSPAFKGGGKEVPK
jgi:hypothetical protein